MVPSHVSVIPGGKLCVVSTAGTPGSDVSSWRDKTVSTARQVLGGRTREYKQIQTNKQKRKTYLTESGARPCQAGTCWSPHSSPGWAAPDWAALVPGPRISSGWTETGAGAGAVTGGEGQPEE